SGVEGHADGARAAGTYGVNPNGPGAWGISTNGMGVYGETSAAHTFTYSAVYGRSYGNGGIGVIGEGGPGTSWGVYGISSGGVAVYAASDSGTGVNGTSGSGIGVNGTSSSNFGVQGTTTSASA